VAGKHSVSPWTSPGPSPSPTPGASSPATAPTTPAAEAPQPAAAEPRSRVPAPPERSARLQIRTSSRVEALVLAEIRRRIGAGERGRGKADRTTVIEDALERAYGHLVPPAKP
jgi:hypothetical protein